MGVKNTIFSHRGPGGPVLALMGPAKLLSFGKHGCELPDAELSPIAAPPWLEAALASASPTADDLVNKYILYKWPPRLGGWAVGKVTSPMIGDAIMVKQTKCNFSVFYECDDAEADHALSMKMYAKSAKSPSDSWVLLGCAAAAPPPMHVTASCLFVACCFVFVSCLFLRTSQSLPPMS